MLLAHWLAPTRCVTCIAAVACGGQPHETHIDGVGRGVAAAPAGALRGVRRVRRAGRRARAAPRRGSRAQPPPRRHRPSCCHTRRLSSAGRPGHAPRVAPAARRGEAQAGKVRSSGASIRAKPRAYPSAFFGSAWRWDDRTDHCDRSALASARDATPETCATLCCEKPKSVGRSGPLDARSLPPSRAVHPLIEREMFSLTLTPALPGWRRALLARWRYARRPRCPLRCACATPRRPTRRSWWTT